MFYSILEAPGVHCTGLIRDHVGNALVAAFSGQRAVVASFVQALIRSGKERKMGGFTVVDDAGQHHFATVSDGEYTSDETSISQIFGEEAALSIFCHRNFTTVDCDQATGWLMEIAPNVPVSDGRIQQNLWALLKQLAPTVLPESWRPAVLAAANHDSIQSMENSAYPPVGNVSAFYVRLTECFGQTIADKIEAGQLPLQDIVDQLNVVRISSKFPVGRLICSPAVEKLARERDGLIKAILRRHCAGDWGCISAEDRQQMDANLLSGGALHSAYLIDPLLARDESNLIYIRTASDRSETLLSLPDEGSCADHHPLFVTQPVNQ
jgi:hypothetical protein